MTRSVSLWTIKPGWHWEAFFPLGVAPAEGTNELVGTVYLCHPAGDGEPEPLVNAHYAIPYDLHFEDGRLLPQSNLMMAATVWTKRYLNNWLSHEPIPELPTKNTDDPRLLGLPVPSGKNHGGR